MENKIPLEPEHYYHIYNHAAGFDNFFNDQSDYQNFLDRYIKYIVPISETIAYCFMPNHFHLFLQIKTEKELEKILRVVPGNLQVDNERISYRFSHFFNSYAQWYNKKYQRQGSLFRSNFKRKLVETEKYFIELVHYIHSNPVKDGFAVRIEQWEYSSYKALLSGTETFLAKDTVVKYFGDVDNFRIVHQKTFEYEDPTLRAVEDPRRVE